MDTGVMTWVEALAVLFARSGSNVGHRDASDRPQAGIGDIGRVEERGRDQGGAGRRRECSQAYGNVMGRGKSHQERMLGRNVADRQCVRGDDGTNVGILFIIQPIRP